ncbi:hypothetical protein AB0N05_30395 [Nocardia sp. NPDC051030]|uniref:hypothetical protein n=1 Tax=Nocardia sp. NPDC051030 TaxID=3155162 RepID=UPI003441954B
MRLVAKISRISAVVAATAVTFGIAGGTASADIVRPEPGVWPFGEQSEFGHVIGDTLSCQINYRIWVENEPGAPRRGTVKVQALGIDTLPWGPADRCGQWVTVRINVGIPEHLGGVKWIQQDIYLEGGRAPGAPISVDTDLTDISSPGPMTLIVSAMSRPGGYIPFANWGPEASISVVYKLP